ncbi:MAG: hypothetical protein L6R39_001241 [Caloplaca ligustica]|nr:MAG: hypothetical protein L6R39_001241 [Caloplaca ligustica]
MSESVPSSITGFAHRRSRADSTASFIYFQEGEASPEWTEEEAVIDHSDEESQEIGEAHDYDSPSQSISFERRKSSVYSRGSFEDPLLRRHASTRSSVSHYSKGARTYLVLRWLPHWRVWLIGEHRPLRDSSWVVVENQWGEFEVHDLTKEQYGYTVSTVFGSVEKRRHYVGVEEDDDPVMTTLRFLDYRYIRFCFHPLKDKFMPCSDWKDSNWTDVRRIRSGLDSDERFRREQVFGKNQIEIKQNVDHHDPSRDEVNHDKASRDLAF